MAGGFLTGKHERGPDGDVRGPDGARGDFSDDFGPFSERAWGVLDAAEEVAAAAVDAPPAQVALR